jgi:hypothetical protein
VLRFAAFRIGRLCCLPESSRSAAAGVAAHRLRIERETFWLEEIDQEDDVVFGDGPDLLDGLPPAAGEGLHQFDQAAIEREADSK